MLQIQKTKNYEMFQKMVGNRRILKSNFKKLLSSVQNDNQLEIHPIIVNKDFMVIDGQHRLEVAKSLGVDIFYIQSETVPDIHFIEANVNQKTLEVDNYIDYFAVKEKNPVYIQLKEMLRDSGLKPKALLTLILGVVSNNILDFLKTGKFQFPDTDNHTKIICLYHEFIEYAKDKRIRPISMFTNHNFTRSFRWLHNTSGFDSSVLFKKLDLRWFDLKPQRTSEDWYELLLNIYNFKNHNRLEANENI